MKPKIGFICVHNSCRSQMAEAITKLIGSDVLEPYSAGTETKDHINHDAVRIIKERYGIDMRESQQSKTLDAIPQCDIVVTMGCNVDCPWIPSKHREDWVLDDPTGKGDIAFKHTVNEIESKIKDLIQRIESGEISVSC